MLFRPPESITHNHSPITNNHCWAYIRKELAKKGLIETNSPKAVHVYDHVLVHVDGLLILSNTNAGTAESFRVSPPEAVIDHNGIRSHFGVSAGGRFFPPA